MFSYIQTLDFNLLYDIKEHLSSPILNHVLPAYTRLGDGGFIWLFLCFLLLLSKKYRRCGIYALVSLFLANILGDHILKPLFGRIRPCNVVPEMKLLIPRPHGFSFPSGHTMSSFTCATAVYLCHKRLGHILYPFAFLMGFSRLYLFVHFPTDVLCGGLLGILTAYICVHYTRSVHADLKDYLSSRNSTP